MAASTTSDRVRRLGPLTGLAVAAFLAFVVLPSSLTLPNPSPTSQEEVAPVPPTASKLNPPVSNFTSLSAASSGNGLGSGSGSAPGKLPGQLPPPPPLPVGAGNVPPATYDCVNGRQTEDPLAPTCVPYFQGDNGGSTYQGVTRDEVRILIYFDPYGTLNTSQGESTPPYNTIVDVDKPPLAREHPNVYVNRAWEKYFDTRYASYGRHVHIFVQFGSFDSAGNVTPGTQTQDAALGYAKVHPFAVLNYSSFGNGAYYNNYQAQHGALIFGSVAGRSQKFYQQFPGQQWGYLPPYERGASQYAEMICSVLKGKPTTDVGPGNNPAVTSIANGQPRKYGLVYTTDPAFSWATDAAKLAAADVSQLCGISVAVSVTYPHNSYSVDNSQTPQYAINDVLKLAQANVTTVLWPAGYEDKISQQANAQKYYPEWILGDDNQQAANFGASFQDQTEWAHAWIVTSQTYLPARAEQVCYQAYRSVDKSSADSDVVNFACPEYPDLRQLYTGIQVAGPNLTTQSLDQGFHAIPAVPSSNPQVPSCFYLVSDYTCVKDSAIEHYDSTGQSASSSQPGCWRMVKNGARYLPGKFPTTNLDTLKNASDVCNNFSQAVNLDTAPPAA